MSSAFRKALKSQQRNHRERSQPGFRKHLGFLEKKKDYKIRANDYHSKQNQLRALRRKALEKNPDEFYHKMITNKLKDGVHVLSQSKEEMTEEQLKVMRTQDIKYVEMKRVAEAKVTSQTVCCISAGCTLKQRIEREKKMFVIVQKIQTRKDLADKVKKVKVKNETVNSPPIYKFKTQRKR
ncbi:probable U3 small nucleolar RNA-associated protein 11 [Polyodon spathula]|uniref:probable U3 small nucleolar RNA-associated protein 11 n=1 Tax=Polyodon spathula TaxID=7913 RepID=UPI001B7E898A|nr:probable U3 small nucleolar RNA-associated protein 11 [Polyodon spathula]